MDETRLARYAEKFNHADERLTDFREWSKGDNEMAQAASSKALQEIAESLADVCAMLMKDLGRAPTDDHSNLTKLQEIDVLPPDQKETLQGLIELRNQLLFDYDEFSWDRVLKCGKRLAPEVGELTENLRERIALEGMSKEDLRSVDQGN